MITVTFKNRSVSSFVQKEGERLDLSISACGYGSVWEGNTCIFKFNLSEVKNIFAFGLIIYSHWKHRGKQ